jgi:hypothetical protein
MNRKPMTPAISHSLLEALKLVRMTYAEMEEECGLNRQVLARWVASLREDKVLRVGGWTADARGYLTVPQFEFGDSPDVPRPTPKTAAERMRATRERRKVQ